VKIVIDHQIRLIDVPKELIDWLAEQLTFVNPKYTEAVNNGRSTYGLKPYIYLFKTIPQGIVIPRGYLGLLEETLIGQGHNIEIVDNRIILPPINVDSLINLRPYQEKAKINLTKKSHGLLVAPAASGKTIMGLDLFSSLRQKMLWVTHTNRLANQVIDRIDSVFNDISKKDVGFIGAGKWNIGDKITIGMVPTLVRRELELLALGKEFGLVIIDETHHVPASTFIKVLGYFSSYYMYGLTATPYRRDKLEGMMFAAVGPINATVDRKELRKRGNIITPKVIKRIVRSEKVEINDFHYVMSNIVMKNEARLYMIINDVIKEINNNNYCIVISTRKVYCENIYSILESKLPGKSVIATGDYSRKHNDAQVKKIEDGEVNALITTFELLGEGFDVQRLNRGFIVLPFREKARVEQAVGRIQRTHKDKTDAILYDYVDCDIGILKNQFRHRAEVYSSLGMKIMEI